MKINKLTKIVVDVIFYIGIGGYEKEAFDLAVIKKKT